MQSLPPTYVSPRNGNLVLNGHPGLTGLSVAVVHDWLPVFAGAERVLEQILQVLPQAEIYTLIESLREDEKAFLKGKDVRTSFIQSLPFAGTKYPYYLPLAPLAIEQFDLTSYDIVVSSNYVVAKGALTTADQLHICYMHTPIRYAWDLQFQYLREGGIEKGFRSLIARCILHYMRMYDVSAANRVDAFVANSQNVARRIWRAYRRRAEVIYPPVDTEFYTPIDDREDYYVTLSRLVPYKRVDLIVDAFAEMPEKELFVIGEGPELNKIKSRATSNVTVLGRQPADAVRFYLQRARALVFAGEEDFGIVCLEAQACGTPVIAFNKGGALETVKPGETGIFFDEQSVSSLKEAVRYFEFARLDMDTRHIRAFAEKFSAARFRREFSELLRREYETFSSQKPNDLARNGSLH